MRNRFKRMMTILLALSFLFCLGGCGTNESESKKNSAEPTAELVEVEITMDNFYDYFDFEQTSDGKWITVNKKYDEGMIIWDVANLEVATGTKFDEDGNHGTLSSLFSTAFSEQPEITDAQGTVIFAENGKSYINDEGWLVMECGSKSNSHEIKNDERASYFEEYPY